jgi:hypothetical protein
VKYFVTFASRHPDAMRLLNDIMGKAYDEALHDADAAREPLFATVDWKDLRDIADLPRIMLETVRQHGKPTRQQVCDDIIKRQFMRFRRSEYLAAIQTLIANKKIDATKPLNDKSVLTLREQP